MTLQNLKKLLDNLYNLPTYSEDRISEEQYNFYNKRLGDAEAKGPIAVEQAIKTIVCELYITQPTSARRIAYPFDYDEKVIEWKEKQFRKGTDGKLEYPCSGCSGKYHPVEYSDSRLELTIDHNPPLSVLFNNGDWQNDIETRRETYNNTNNMRLMCRSKNSSIGGERYKPELIAEVYLRELQYHQ